MLPLFLVLALNTNLMAQTQVDSLRLATAAMKIPIQSLLGFWNPVDSTLSKIEFIKNHYLVIKSFNQLMGYTFIIENDSVHANGVMANWPPYDCILNLKSPDLLEIHYFQYFSTKTSVATYIRQ